MKKIFIVVAVSMLALSHNNVLLSQDFSRDTTSSYYSQSPNRRANNKILLGSTLVIMSSTAGYYCTKDAYYNAGLLSGAFIYSTVLTTGLFGIGVELIREAIIIKHKNRKAKRFKKAINYNNNNH